MGDDLAYAEFVEHASHKAKVVENLAMRGRLVGHHNLLYW
jgi:hypothetical protein